MENVDKEAYTIVNHARLKQINCEKTSELTHSVSSFEVKHFDIKSLTSADSQASINGFA